MKKQDVFIVDFETRSKCNLKTRGAYNYSKDESTSIIIFGIIHKNKFYDGMEKLAAIKKINKSSIIVAHNWVFDYLIFNRFYPEICPPPENWVCTMALSYRNGLPGKLAEVSNALRLKNRKLKDDGSKLINKYSKPNKKGVLIDIPDDDMKKFRHYCEQDLWTTKELFEFLPDLTEETEEFALFNLDKKINRRGVQTDLKRVAELKAAYDKQIEAYKIRAKQIAGEEESGTLTLMSPPGIIKWLSDHGVNVPDSQAATLKEVLDNTKSKKIKEALTIKRFLAAASVKKLNAFTDYSDEKGIVRFCMQYFGAHTGRWAGRTIQPHNFVKKTPKNYVEAYLDYLSDPTNIDKLKLLMRGLMIPRNKYDFVIGDYSAIEARLLFWVTGCIEPIKVYENDGDIYKHFAAKYIFKRPEDEITDIQRGLGKTCILGLGYGTGKDKLHKTVNDAGIPLSLIASDKIVKIYRKAYPQIPKFWRDMENVFKALITAKPGKTEETKYKGIWFMRTNRSIRIYLPSGRFINYYLPGMKKNGQLFYRPDSVQLKEIWGGVLVENIIQAIARDMLRFALLRIDAVGIDIVLHIHDEIVCEVLKTQSKNKLNIFSKIMHEVPDWAKGYPPGAECFVSDRFEKR